MTMTTHDETNGAGTEPAFLDWPEASYRIPAHDHQWGTTESARFGGGPVRHCTVDGCRVVDVYFDDEPDDDEDDGADTQPASTEPASIHFGDIVRLASGEIAGPMTVVGVNPFGRLNVRLSDGTYDQFDPSEVSTEPASTEPALARRVKFHEARRHFEAGGTVMVSEYGHETSIPVGPTTTVHTRETTTWDALVGMVNEWRHRYPYQRYYIVDVEPAEESMLCRHCAEPIHSIGTVRAGSAMERAGMSLGEHWAHADASEQCGGDHWGQLAEPASTEPASTEPAVLASVTVGPFTVRLDSDGSVVVTGNDDQTIATIECSLNPEDDAPEVRVEVGTDGAGQDPIYVNADGIEA